jgi:hypothetical protein
MTESDSGEPDEEVEPRLWETLVLLLICAVALPFEVLRNLWFVATGRRQKYRRIFGYLRLPRAGTL